MHTSLVAVLCNSATSVLSAGTSSAQGHSRRATLMCRKILARKLPRGQPLGPPVGCNLIADTLPQSADVVGDGQVRTDQHHSEVGFLYSRAINGHLTRNGLQQHRLTMKLRAASLNRMRFAGTARVVEIWHYNNSITRHRYTRARATLWQGRFSHVGSPH